MDKIQIEKMIELAWGESFKLVSYSYVIYDQGINITATLADKKGQSRIAFFNYHKGKLITSPVAKNQKDLLHLLSTT